MRPVRLCLVFSLALLALLACKPVKSADGLVASLTLDRTSYVAGDNLRFWLTFSNPTADTVALTFSDMPVCQVSVLSLFGVDVAGYPTMVMPLSATLLLAPGESSTESASFTLAGSGVLILPGPYWVRGKLVGYDRPYAEKLITVSLAANR